MTSKNAASSNKGFGNDYWEKNYSVPMEMDNIGNAPEHVRYVQSLFHLEQIEIDSIIDLGFGLGHLFERFITVFRPRRVYGIEPSLYAFNELKKRFSPPEETKKQKLVCTDIKNWAQNLASDKEKVFDLGLCTSVFQYLTDEEIEFVLPHLAKKVRYLYFSVPTDVEFRRQKEEFDFVDEYAIHRKKEKYLKWIRPHFAFVGTRLLESKIHFDENNSEFREQLFRF